MKLSCGHTEVKDLSQGLGDSRHWYCPKCGMHHYNGREWTRKEWAEYVEDFSDERQT